MLKPRVGLLAFSESHARNDVYKKRKPIWDRELQRFVAVLEADADIVWPSHREIRGKREAVQAVQEIHAAVADCAVLYPPTFVAPALVAHAANLLNVPIALVHNEAPDSLSQLAFLAVAGAMDQIGVPCLRLPGDYADAQNWPRLMAFLRAAAARQRLRGQTYGSIGGRSLGISTGSADVAQWERLFGVDIEHIDQFEIARRSENQNPERVSHYINWLSGKSKTVAYNDSNFTPAHLQKQVGSYLATKELVKLYELDFMGVKCQPEMSNGYCLQCINVALSNDPYDADGFKQPVPCSCEADADGALTMQVLNLLSGGKPTNLNDIAWLTAHEMTLANCGSMATYFAGLSPEPDHSLACVQILPHSFGEAGGAATVFTVPAGIEMTFARFFRREGKYALGVLSGVTEIKDRAAQSATIQTRPLIFLRMNIDKNRFLETFGSNHIHGIEGDFKRELRSFAEILGIDFFDYDING